MSVHPVQNSEDPLSALDRDIRALMREAAEARFAAEEQRRAAAENEQRILLSLLNVDDAFDRVFRAVEAKQDQVTPQMKIWLGNFRSARRLLQKLIDEQGVKPIDTATGEFDPVWHVATETVADADRPPGTIIQVLRRGYVRDNQILRKAEVVVVEGSEQ